MRFIGPIRVISDRSGTTLDDGAGIVRKFTSCSESSDSRARDQPRTNSGQVPDKTRTRSGQKRAIPKRIQRISGQDPDNRRTRSGQTPDSISRLPYHRPQKNRRKRRGTRVRARTTPHSTRTNPADRQSSTPVETLRLRERVPRRRRLLSDRPPTSRSPRAGLARRLASSGHGRRGRGSRCRHRSSR